MVNDEILKIEIQNRFDELMKARSGIIKITLRIDI